MAKIGTAHVEIKPVINDEALAQITAAITRAVKEGVEAGIKAAQPEPVKYSIGGVRVTHADPHAVGVQIQNRNPGTGRA